MAMKILNILQGTPEWHAHRATHWNASDAPAMLGCSAYENRTQLLHRLATGIAPEHDAATQRRFADGHRAEALARPLAEAIIGDELYPVVGADEALAIHGRALSASFDGLTLDGMTAFEHKALNEELRAAIELIGRTTGEDGSQLPEAFRVQMEQQLLVSGAERVLFMASKWDADGNLIEVQHCWYFPNAELRAKILAGWRQFAEDLAAYVPGAPAPEKVIAEPVEALPAPVVQVTGQIALQDNFKLFEERLRDFLDNKLIREPKTDQDFADLDGQIKAMKAAREALKSAEAQMLAQVQPVDQAKKHKDMLDTLLQQNVSMAEKLLTAEKDRRKLEIVNGATIALRQHIDKLNTRFERAYLAYAMVPADFGGVVRGLKSLASMEDKVGTELARCKIEAHELADRIHANREDLKPGPGAIPGDDWISLFPDFAQVCTKTTEDFRNLRIARVEAERQRREAERARIRAEEQERADREARAKLAAEQAQQAKPVAPVATPVAPPAPVSAPAAKVVPLSRTAPAVNTSVRVKLGDINAAIAPLSITADGLAALGFSHVATEMAAKLYRQSDLPAIYAAMVGHIEAVQAKQAA